MRYQETHQTTPWITWISVILIGSAGVVSCAAQPNESGRQSTIEQSAPEALSASSDNEQQPKTEAGLAADTQSTSPTQLRQSPQLIKTASLTLRVTDVEKTLDEISSLLSQQQGDLLKLDDQQPRGTGDRDLYTLQIRIPQGNLNATLDALEALGAVRKRSIQAQDVSDQLVDAQARLKNLRKSEEMVLKIMDRSGSIPDVLSASKELSSIRENIERIDAQLQNLKTQVAFSTINLRIESATASIEPQAGVGLQLQDAWKRSTSAMGNLTMALLKLGLWGVAFSPYLVALGLLIWLGRRYRVKTLDSVKPSNSQAEAQG